MAEPTPRKFINRAEVIEATGLSYTTIWNWMRRGHFPCPRQLGPGRVGWDADEIDAWMASRPVAKVKPLEAAHGRG